MQFQFLETDDLKDFDYKNKVIFPPYFEMLKESLESYDNLKSFLNSHRRIKKWLIISDYALDDQNKNGNFITFTLVPNYFAIDHLMKTTRSLQSKDIKKTKTINPDFIQFLRSSIFFNISIELPSNREEMIGSAKKYFTCLYECLEQNYNDPKVKSQCRYFISKLNGKSKFPLHVDIDLISCIVSLIELQLFKHVPDIENICWLSDRDKILTTFGQEGKEQISPMIFNLINYRSKMLFSMLTVPFKKNSEVILSFGYPEPVGRMWYDSLIRIPDFIVGSLADNDQQEMIVSKEIFKEVLEKVISNEDLNLIFRINFINGELSTTKTIYSHNVQDSSM